MDGCCEMGLKIGLPKIVHHHFPWQHMATLGYTSFSQPEDRGDAPAENLIML